MSQRLVGLMLVLSATAACMPPVSHEGLAPKRGPKAKIYASYTGGIVSRNAQARFSVESDAYVLVGHLGGDGYIRILHPTNPRERGAIRKGKTFTTNHVYAAHDAIPALFQARYVRYRHLGARMDSYDGAGNGYFFIIASRFPLSFDEISEGSQFDIIEVPNYFDTFDPRLTIRALGDLVSRGSPYTLEFATNFGAVNYASAFDQQLDCAFLAASGLSFGTLGLWAQPYYYAFGAFGRRNLLDNCASQYAFAFQRPSYYYSNNPTTTVLPPRTQTPGPTIRPPWQRRVTPTRAGSGTSARSYLPDRVNQRAEAHRRAPRLSPGSSDIYRTGERLSSSSGAAREAASARPAERQSERASERSPSSQGERQASKPDKRDP